MIVNPGIMRTKLSLNPLLSLMFDGSVGSATFTGGSNRYNPETGVLAGTDAPRYVTGHSSQAVFVESASNQLINYSNNAFSTQWTSVSMASVTDNNCTDPFGNPNNASTFVFAATSGANVWKSSGTTAAGTYTGSFWLRTPSGTVTLRIDSYDSGVSDYFSTNLTVTTTWQRFTFSRTTASTAIKGLALWNGTDGLAKTVQVYGAQLEPTGYATSNIIAAATVLSRGAESMLHPTSGVIAAATGAVNMWVKVDAAKQSSSALQYYFHHGTSSSNNLIRIFKSGANEYGFHVSNDVGTLCGGYVTQTLAAGWHMFTITYGPAGTFGYIDAVQVVADTSGVVAPTSLATDFYIGSNISGTQQADTAIDSLTTYGRALSQSAIDRLYAA